MIHREFRRGGALGSTWPGVVVGEFTMDGAVPLNAYMNEKLIGNNVNG
jgi:hypothetical protein